MARASLGTNVVIVDPAEVKAFSSMVTGAMRVLLLPIYAPFLIVVQALLK